MAAQPSFRLVADGAYASLLRYEFPRTAVITRLRCNVAIFDLGPPRTGQRGRPRIKGQRPATPLAARPGRQFSAIPLATSTPQIATTLISVLASAA